MVSPFVNHVDKVVLLQGSTYTTWIVSQYNLIHVDGTRGQTWYPEMTTWIPCAWATLPKVDHESGYHVSLGETWYPCAWVAHTMYNSDSFYETKLPWVHNSITVVLEFYSNETFQKFNDLARDDEGPKSLIILFQRN